MYNGYPNWNQWNVSLWINNDEGLYRMALDFIRSAKRFSGTYGHVETQSPRDRAARHMLATLKEVGLTHTPDGAKYTKTAIRKAMVGL